MPFAPLSIMRKMSRFSKTTARRTASNEGKTCREPLSVALGLSKADFDKLVHAMMAVVVRVGYRRHTEPIDVVYDAFVLAFDKPISERPPATDQRRFFGWMCTLAEYAAFTSRKSKHHRVYQSTAPDSLLQALMLEIDPTGRLEAREELHKAFEVLDATDRALIEAHILDNQPISHLASEQGIPPSTLQSRYDNAIAALRMAITTLGRRPFRRFTAAIVPMIVTFAHEARAHIAAMSMRALRQSTRLPLRFVLGAAIGTGLVVAPMPSPPAAASAEMPRPAHTPIAQVSIYEKKATLDVQTEAPPGVPGRTTRAMPPAHKALQSQVAAASKNDAPLWIEWMTFNETRHRARKTKRISLQAP